MRRTHGAVAGVLLLIGLALVGWGTYATLQENDRAALPETDGTVVSAELEAVPGEDAYRPNVTYRYTVEGTTYTDDTVFPESLDGQGSREWAEGVVEEYEAGDSVAVTYDPERPERSYIRERRSPTPVISFGMGMVALAFAFVFGVAAFQSGRDPVQSEPFRIVDSEGEDDRGGEDAGDASDSATQPPDDPDGNAPSGDGPRPEDQDSGSGNAADVNPERTGPGE